MAPDPSYQPKVYKLPGGNILVVASAGRIRIEDDGFFSFGDDDDVQATFDGTDLIITGLPTSDPLSVGALWSDSGVLTLSGGAPSGP